MRRWLISNTHRILSVLLILSLLIGLIPPDIVSGAYPSQAAAASPDHIKSIISQSLLPPDAYLLQQSPSSQPVVPAESTSSPTPTDTPVILPEVLADSTSVYLHGLNLIAQQSGQDTSYYHADGLGSVRTLTDSAGQVVGSYSYDAFGAVRQKSGVVTNSHRFTGEEADETGLIYLRARYYDPSTGRFISRDPFKGEAANPMSQHPYAYSYNNPVNLTDPSGQVVDTAVDIGFIFYDLNQIMFDNVFGKKDNLGENAPALGADVVSALTPCFPGGGLLVRGGIEVVGHADEAYDGVRAAQRVWRRGDAENIPTPSGKYPSWETVRRRLNINEGLKNAQKWSQENLERLLRGRNPIDFDGAVVLNGIIEMELAEKRTTQPRQYRFANQITAQRSALRTPLACRDYLEQMAESNKVRRTMPRDDIYKETGYSKEWAEQGRPEVVYRDAQPVMNGQHVRISLVSQNSPNWQGVRVAIDYGKGGLEMNETFHKRGFFWWWTPGMPNDFTFKCITNKGILTLCNAYWPKDDKQHWSLIYGCGMIVEEKENLLIYHCNDVGFDTNFDKLVFSLEKLPLKSD